MKVGIHVGVHALHPISNKAQMDMTSVKALMARMAGASMALLGFVVALPAHAQIEYESQLATSTQFIGLLRDDITATVIYVVGAIFGVIVLLAAIGYGWRKFKSKTGMRPF